MCFRKVSSGIALMLAIALAVARPAFASPPLCVVTGNIYPIPASTINVDFYSTGVVPQVIGTSTIPPNTLFHTTADPSTGNIAAVSIPQGLQVRVLVNGTAQQQPLTIPQTSTATLDAIEGLSNNPLQILTFIFGGTSYPLASTGPMPGQFLNWNGSAIGGSTLYPTDFIPPYLGERSYGTENKSVANGQTGVWQAANAVMLAIVPSGSVPVIDAVSTQGIGNASNSLTLNNVATPIVGEYEYAFACAHYANGPFPAWSVSSGWTNLVYSTPTIRECGIWRRQNQSGDPSTFVWSGNTGFGTMTGFIWEVAGDSAAASPPTNNSIVAPGSPSISGITTTSANNLAIVCFGGEYNRPGFSIPSGYQLIMDPGAPVAQINPLTGGAQSNAVWSNGTAYISGSDWEPEMCAYKVMASAGATGSASAIASQLLVAYNGGLPGEIDMMHLIIDGTPATQSILNPYLTVYRDGETTPSINIQPQDLTGRRAIGNTAMRFHGRHVNFGAGMLAGRGEDTLLYRPIPFTKSVVAMLSNPDTSSSDSVLMWSNVDWHANQATSSANWNGPPRVVTLMNSSFPSADSVAAYAEDTLCTEPSGTAGALVSIGIQVTGGDNNSQTFEEGRVRMYVDGETTASWDSSGTEDFFQSSFNWGGETIPMSFDLFGTTLYTSPGSGNPGAFSAQRTFGSADPVTFRNGFKLTWTSGNQLISTVTNPVSVFSRCDLALTQ